MAEIEQVNIFLLYVIEEEKKSSTHHEFGKIWPNLAIKQI
jgi:hypothetical protein